MLKLLSIIEQNREKLEIIILTTVGRESFYENR